MNKEKLPSNKNFGIVFFVVFLIVALWPLKYEENVRMLEIFIQIFVLFLYFVAKNLQGLDCRLHLNVQI